MSYGPGPTGGVFTGDPYVPGRGASPPQVQTVDATTTAPFVATLQGGPTAGRLLRRVYIRGPVNSIARLHVGDHNDARSARDVSLSGDEDTAEYAPEIYVNIGQAVTVKWDTPPAGALCFATYEWIDL